jgi:hypothetical protein
MNTRLEAMILVSENQGADERPISIGDSTILFIRLTFANADDDFEWRKSVISTSATACAELQNVKAAPADTIKTRGKSHVPASSCEAKCGPKQSGVGRKNRKMMLDHYRQTKKPLVSYSPRAVGFF